MNLTATTYGASLDNFGLTRIGLTMRFRIVKRFIVGDSLLDVGCANGAMMELLEPSVRTIVGVEPGIFPRQHANIVSAMAENLPFANETFDTVICSATRKHLNDPLKVMGEMVRVLRKNGRVIVIDPHPLFVKLGVLAGKFDSRYIRHNSWASEISREMKSFGLHPIHSANHLFVQCVGEKH